MERKRQKDRNRRLILALLMLLITGITLSTATYAWFSANTIVTTEDIDIKVEASSGISIAADALTFGKSISFSDVVDFAAAIEDDTVSGLTDAMKKNTLFANPEKLNPVTTVGGTGFKFFTGVLDDEHDNQVVLADATYTGSQTIKTSGGNRTGFTNGNYMVFDVYLRSSIVQDIRISKRSELTPKAATGIDSQALDSALRIGVQYMGYTSAISQTQAVNLNDKAQGFIWNVKPYQRHQDSLYLSYVANPTSLSGTDKTNIEHTYGYMAGKADSANAFIKYYYRDYEDDTYFEKVSTADDHYLESSSAATDYAPETKLFTVQPGINKVRLYIWLEGQDLDCVNYITFSDGLTLNLSFEVIPSTPVGP